MRVFNMTFVTLTDALNFFGFEPVSPLPACSRPRHHSPLGFAATRSNFEMVGGGLFWFRDEDLFTAFTDNGDGVNRFDGEDLRHISVVEGIDPEGFSTPILVEWNPVGQTYHRVQLAEGTVYAVPALDMEGDARVAVFVSTHNVGVFVMVVTHDQYLAVETLAHEILNRA